MDVADHWQECSSHRVVALGVIQFAAQPEAPVRDALHSQHAGLKVQFWSTIQLLRIATEPSPGHEPSVHWRVSGDSEGA